MAFPDPITMTIDAVAVSLPRVGMTDMSGRFQSADRQYTTDIEHSSKSRYRHVVRVRDDQVVSNPSIPDQNITVSATASLTIDFPKNGYGNEDAVNLLKAAATFILEGANAEKLVGGQA